MRITKISHSCLLIEERDLMILIDPGGYSDAQNELSGIDVMLVTHEHQDHLYLPSVRSILTRNPDIRILTNSAVAEILSGEEIQTEILEHDQRVFIGDVSFEGYGKKHAAIHPSIPVVVNTGYCIAGRFFHPGDAFTFPNRHIEVLALPVAGSWLKLTEVLEYARKFNPKVCFPIHDGMLNSDGSERRLPEEYLSNLGIEYRALNDGEALTV